MPKKTTTKSATTKPVITRSRSRESVLISTTPAKLVAQIGGDTTILVSRKYLRNLLNKDATAKILADLQG